MKRNRIVIYTDLLENIELLNNEQLGQIFKSLLQLSEGKQLDIIDDESNIALQFIIGKFIKQI